MSSAGMITDRLYGSYDPIIFPLPWKKKKKGEKILIKLVVSFEAKIFVENYKCLQNSV